MATAKVRTFRLTDAESADVDELRAALVEESGERLRDRRRGYGVSRADAVAEAVRRTLRELRPAERES